MNGFLEMALAWFRRNVSEDVPPAQSACLDCEWSKATDCTADHKATCEARIAEASAVERKET